MVVEKIELVVTRETREDMLELHRHLADPGAGRLAVNELELRDRPRVTRGEQRHVYARPRQAVREQADDRLGAAVLRRRHRKPGRRDHPDAHLTPSPSSLPLPQGLPTGDGSTSKRRDYSAGRLTPAP